MATLTLETNMRIALGGESARFDISRANAAATNKVVDATFTLPDGQALGSETTLWQSAQHASASALTSPFGCMFIVADPDTLGPSALPVDVEVTHTINGGAINSTTYRIDRNTPLFLPSSITGTTFTIADSANPSRITRIKARNPAVEAAGVNDVQIRIVGFL